MCPRAVCSGIGWGGRKNGLDGQFRSTSEMIYDNPSCVALALGGHLDPADQDTIVPCAILPHATMTNTYPCAFAACLELELAAFLPIIHLSRYVSQAVHPTGLTTFAGIAVCQATTYNVHKFRSDHGGPGVPEQNSGKRRKAIEVAVVLSLNRK